MSEKTTSPNNKPVFLPTEFKAQNDRIIAIIRIADMSLNLHFMSPEHILEFTSNLMDAAVNVWPDHPLIKDYINDELQTE